MGQGSPGGAVRDVSQSPCDLPALPLAHVTVAGPAASYGIVTNVPRAVSRGGVSVYTFDRGIVEACKVKPRLLRQRRSAHRRGRESPCDFEAGQVVRICQSTLNQQPAVVKVYTADQVEDLASIGEPFTFEELQRHRAAVRGVQPIGAACEDESKAGGGSGGGGGGEGVHIGGSGHNHASGGVNTACAQAGRDPRVQLVSSLAAQVGPGHHAPSVAHTVESPGERTYTRSMWTLRARPGQSDWNDESCQASN